MVYSKQTDEIIKELNSLIVQAKETAEDTKKYRGVDSQVIAFYEQFWELVAGRTEKMAEKLQEILKRVEMAAQNSDEISAYFLLVKVIDDTAFEANVTAFQVGLMISRAMPEHQSLFQPLCAKYDSLAQNAQIKSRKMVEFLNELSNLIFRDMRKQAEQRIQNAVKSGKAVADKLSDSTLPYGYIADGIAAIVEELDSVALEDLTLSSLTDAVFTLDTIHFAACTDILRTPDHRQLFDGITNFKGELDEAVKFFCDLSEDGLRTFGEAGNVSDEKFTEERVYKDMAMQEGVALFYLKGEVQKLGDERLDESQKTAFRAICHKIDSAITMSRSPINEEEKSKIAELLRGAYDELTKEAKRLDPYGGAIQYLAEKVKMPLKYLVK